MPPRLPARVVTLPSSSAQHFPSPISAIQPPTRGLVEQRIEKRNRDGEREPGNTRQRENMRRWLDDLQEKIDGARGRPHYLGPLPGQPFPLNPLFRSQPVLSEEARESIWSRVIKDGEALKVVSADLGVDVRRVAAVVRLKEVEKRWVAENKPLARPYAKAIMEMLPQTRYREGAETVHEPISDVHVHSYTMQQLFLPTSESRHFTRDDAALAFHKNMRPAEQRIPHEELIQLERDIHQGEDPKQSVDKFQMAAQASERKLAEQGAEKEAIEEAQTRRVGSDRFEFRFTDFNAENVGSSGRRRNAVGWKYGAPLDDRKRGKVKIPTQVP